MLNTRGQRHRESKWKRKCSGERKPTRKHDPRQPSEQDRIEHEMTHLPFRSWCRHCIKGSGGRTVAQQLKKRDKSQKSIRTSCSWATKRKGNTLPCLGERATRAALSTSAPRTSTGECRRMMARLREIGLEFVDIIVKSDNEPALTSLMEQ